MLAPYNPACISTDRAGTGRYVASATVDAAIDATNRTTRNQCRRAERKAGAVRTL